MDEDLREIGERAKQCINICLHIARIYASVLSSFFVVLVELGEASIESAVKEGVGDIDRLLLPLGCKVLHGRDHLVYSWHPVGGASLLVQMQVLDKRSVRSHM